MQRWTCSLCLSLLRSPAILPCKHLFCSKCIKTLVIHTAVSAERDLVLLRETLTTRPVPCPLCRSPFNLEQARVDTATRSEMQAARLPCKWSSEGCAVQISPLQIDEHEAECQYATGEHSLMFLLWLPRLMCQCAAIAPCYTQPQQHTMISDLTVACMHC
jgi:Zinc finger, C3HC4 type (RING finger)